MNTKRSLSLRREALTELGCDDLAIVQAAQASLAVCIRPTTDFVGNTRIACWTQPYAGATNCVC